jgi:hypothetical protein
MAYSFPGIPLPSPNLALWTADTVQSPDPACGDEKSDGTMSDCNCDGNDFCDSDFGEANDQTSQNMPGSQYPLNPMASPMKLVQHPSLLWNKLRSHSQRIERVFAIHTRLAKRRLPP